MPYPKNTTFYVLIILLKISTLVWLFLIPLLYDRPLIFLILSIMYFILFCFVIFFAAKGIENK
jgi:hypothetical protein